MATLSADTRKGTTDRRQRHCSACGHRFADTEAPIDSCVLGARGYVLCDGCSRAEQGTIAAKGSNDLPGVLQMYVNNEFCPCGIVGCPKHSGLAKEKLLGPRRRSTRWDESPLEREAREIERLRSEGLVKWSPPPSPRPVRAVVPRSSTPLVVDAPPAALARLWEPKPTEPECLCGCGARVRRHFAPGHDAKLRALAVKVRKGKLRKEDLPQFAMGYLRDAPWMTAEMRQAIGL